MFRSLLQGFCSCFAFPILVSYPFPCYIIYHKDEDYSSTQGCSHKGAEMNQQKHFRKVWVALVIWLLLVIMLSQASLAVPFFSQHWSPWFDDPMGSSPYTIGDDVKKTSRGCVTTDVAMILKHAGADVDPGKLNTWLGKHGGYTLSGDIYWGIAADYDGLGGVLYQGKNDVKDNWNELSSQLGQGRLVIVKVDADSTKRGVRDHWVLVTAKIGLITSDPGCYSINDPALEEYQLRTLRHYYNNSHTGATFFKMRYYSGPWGATASLPPTPTPVSPGGQITGQIEGYQVSPNPVGVGDSVSFRVTVKNTGNTRHTFVAGLSVWKVGASISTSIIGTNQQVTLDPNQQQTLTLRTYSFSSSQAGDWYYQFGLWKDQVGRTLLHKAPSPAEIISIAKFLIGNRAQVTQNLNVRTGPGVSYSEITNPDYPGYAPNGTRGTVLEGPVSADGYVWWKVRYDQGYGGWSVENGLSKI
jgi:hypothetical protein